MTEKFNILVVEDEQFHIDRIYKRALSDTRFDVDYANTESEAKEKIRCKYYHIAYVDIMLREDSHDRGGIEVIKYFHELNEPTSIIVVSATDDIKVALDAYKSGICGFLQKDAMHTPREDILVPLEKAIDNIKHLQSSPYGRFSNVVAYLANPELMPYWEDSWTRWLGVSYSNMLAAFNNSLASRIPILRRKGDHLSLIKSQDGRKSAHGYFWSKGKGRPIMLSLSVGNCELPVPRNELTSTQVYSRTYGNLQIAVFEISSGMARSEFSESVWDERFD